MYTYIPSGGWKNNCFRNACVTRGGICTEIVKLNTLAFENTGFYGVEIRILWSKVKLSAP